MYFFELLLKSEQIILEVKQTLNKSIEKEASIDLLREDIRNAHDEINCLQEPTCTSVISDEKEKVKSVGRGYLCDAVHFHHHIHQNEKQVRSPFRTENPDHL